MIPTASHHPQALQHPIFKILQRAVANLSIEAYVIGGFVRDYLLERNQKKDIDIVAIGSGIQLAEEVSRLIPNQPKVTVFKNYGTAMLRYEDLELEFVGARKESYNRNSRNPIVENGSLEDDQNRRDFTINTLALQLNEAHFGKLLDPFGGLQDLKDGRIRTPLDPDTTYSDDPLRMLRGIRFASQLNFKIQKASFYAISNNAQRIEIISKERISEELHKILMSDKPSMGFAILEASGLLHYFLPELVALKGVDDIDGQKHKDNFYHTLEVVDNIAKHTDNLWLRWSALLHDIGKAPTKRFCHKNGWTFHGHEYKGGKMVKHIFKRLRLPHNDKMRFVQKMVQMSSRPIIIASDVTDAAVRRLVFDAAEHIDELMTLCEADITTKNEQRFKKYHNNFKKVREKIKEVEERDRIRNFQPPISGKIIMETFNIEPCQEIGQIKEIIKNAILDGKIPNEYEPAYELMLQLGEKLKLNAL